MKTIQFSSAVARSLTLPIFLALFATQTSYPGAVPGDPKGTLTATMDGGTAKTGNSWYEQGVNMAAPASGFRTGLVSGLSDPLSSYLFQSATDFNALMLDNTLKTDTLTFATPTAVSALSLAGSSGNGSGPTY